ncbi:hypothetical protein U9M48_026942 [Paspalum notatum var. saurae]|uniref:Protein FAR1-RELATED SEQUENCE n=1 Tax=Paspalum notatum var. saurae TaxID=547442 RepID=A0AAQ3TTS4_PASNO
MMPKVSSWIPAYFMDMPLVGVLRTTSRFETLECQHQEELKADNRSLHTTPTTMTPWAMEKQCSMIYTDSVFKKFQSQVVAAKDHCFIQDTTESEEWKIVTISSLSGKERMYVRLFGRCSCKLYKSYGIPCRHIIQVLRAEKKNEIPLIYIIKRWKKRCKRYVYNVKFMRNLKTLWIGGGKEEKNSDSRNKFEDLIQMAKQSDQAMDFFFISKILFRKLSSTSISKQDEYESFIGTKIPNEVYIHPPNDIKSKGRCK